MEARWEIINTQPIIPKCKLCDKTTEQMARFYIQPVTLYICSSCARYVKECMDNWKELKSTNYINTDEFDSGYIDTTYRRDKIKGGQHVPKDGPVFKSMGTVDPE